MTVKSCEKVEKSQVELTIEVNAAEFEAAVEKAYQKMRRKISVPGFRPGKAPRKMIERMYGAEVFFILAVHKHLACSLNDVEHFAVALMSVKSD